METTSPDVVLEAPAGHVAPRAAIAFVFVTVMLDMLTLGIIAPVFPKLVLGFVDNDTVRASNIYGIFGTSWALMQFIFSPLLGALSDRFGRRPIIILSNLGLGIDYVVMALAPNLAWLFVGRVVSGITSASAATATAYIADIVPPEKRAGAFGMIGAAFGAGFVLGPAVGGLLGGSDPHLPFWVAAGFSLANAAFGYFVLAESLPRERRSTFSWRKANPLGSFALLRSHHELFGLSAVAFLSQLAGVALFSTYVLYVIYRYGWDARIVGLSLAFVGICSVASGPLTQPIIARIGERRGLMVGLLSGALSMVCYGLAPNGWLFLIGTPIMAFWGLTNAASQAFMTRRVSPSEQGQLQGAMASIRGIAMLVGPGIFTTTFAAFIGGLRNWNVPGAAWLLGALLLLAAMPLAYVVTRPAREQSVAAA